MSMTSNLGNVVRDARMSAGLSQRKLVTKMGFTEKMRTWVSKIENSKVIPTLPILEKLAVAMDTRVSVLIAGAENYKPDPKVKSSMVAGLTRNSGARGAMVVHPAAMAKRKEIGRALGTLPKETR